MVVSERVGFVLARTYQTKLERLIGIACKYQTCLNGLAKDTHSSLFGLYFSDEEKTKASNLHLLPSSLACFKITLFVFGKSFLSLGLML